ncbi:hypothetical protein CYLTODRAFT_449842 [Cylindrobasidium torrendii FP15055 ss-10]|uniref:Uncharacterized protein n=1 Tax=Cylindrobasidium torrendii FP15055 ss-10 TaxID=1314674 RepID=A0A0D7BQH1_9AGAR|nr:hypothetical protein CYLTODRAFT_449842 [Cylindrobasidium torrendii FP15055 ss-10]
MQLSFTPAALLTLLLGSVAMVNASPKMGAQARSEMRSALEQRENCYCYKPGDASVVCGRPKWAENREFYCPDVNIAPWLLEKGEEIGPVTMLTIGTSGVMYTKLN